MNGFSPLYALPPLLAIAGVIAHAAAPQVAAKVEYKKEEIDAAKESIALSVMGQMQFAFGDLMWLKSMEYLHNGMGYRMPTNAEKALGFVERESDASTPAGLDHAEGVTMALDRHRDWRGIVGEIHRAIVPYQDHHSHSDPVELIPWFQLVIKMNPHLERLYTMGAFFMADFAHDPEEALELLEAGVQANPWSFEIHGSLGRLHYEYFSEHGKAAGHLREAIDLGVRERERLRANKDKFDNHQEQIFKESFLFLARALTELGQYEEALDALDQGYELTRYQHLNVQKRIVIRKRDGLPEDAEVELPGA